MGAKMSSKTYCNVTAFIFLLIGIVHVVRVAIGFTFQVGNWDLPRAASAVGAAITLSLAWWGFKAARALAAAV
jgi:hypothetical protein